jgi:23S rRNA (guanine2445-N2)-methyltransferase / 23S rRNA (guanine2069-N7)-methyltransferase
MQGEFDMQRDHVELIRTTLLHLAPGGLLIFSNNFRRFRLDAAALADLDVQDITAATIPHDFARNPRIHQCFEIRVPRGAEKGPRPLLSLGRKPAADQ